MFYVNVNKHKIAGNAKNGTDEPPIRISSSKSGSGEYAHEIELPAGSRILYSAHKPILKCGARLVIECPTKPIVLR
jgi:hypothetical protein